MPMRYWAWKAPSEYPARCLFCWGKQKLELDENGPYAKCYFCSKEEEFSPRYSEAR